MVYGPMPFRTKADIVDRSKQPPFFEVPGHPRLPDLLRKALNKDRQRRFQTADAFLEELGKCQPGAGRAKRRDTALLFYDRYTGRAEIHRVNPDGKMNLIRAHQWRMSWDFIARLAEPDGSRHSLLFVQSSTGRMEFYRVDQSGELRSESAAGQVEEGLSQVLSVESEQRAWVLRYSATAGTGAISQFSETGACVVEKKHPRWHTHWTQIVKARRRDSRLPGVLLYDAASGVGEFYDILDDGEISLTRAHTGWSRSWSEIVSIHPAHRDGTTLLFYDRSAKRGEFYSVEADGDIALLRAHEGWRSTWSHIVPIESGCEQPPVLLFFDAAAGQATFYRVGDEGQFTKVASREGWSKSWSHILALRV